MNGPKSSHRQQSKSADVNINGEVRDQDTFVLGDDEEEDEEVERPGLLGDDGAASIPSPPPLYESIVDPWKEEGSPHETAPFKPTSLAEEPFSKVIEPDDTRPYKYFINRSDTLQGLSLRFGIDVSAIYNMINFSEQ